jgi:hypothetical protein
LALVGSCTRTYSGSSAPAASKAAAFHAQPVAVSVTMPVAASVAVVAQPKSPAAIAAVRAA